MNNRLLSFLLLTTLFIYISSCNNDDDTNLAEEIVGTYLMTSYDSQQGSFTPGSEDLIVITRVGDNKVNVLIDYAQVSSDQDVNLENMNLSEVNNTIVLEAEFSNANANGTIVGDDLQLSVNYDDGDFAIIEASR